jgi:hypothetical protein
MINQTLHSDGRKASRTATRVRRCVHMVHVWLFAISFFVAKYCHLLGARKHAAAAAAAAATGLTASWRHTSVIESQVIRSKASSKRSKTAYYDKYICVLICYTSSNQKKCDATLKAQHWQLKKSFW